MARKKASRARRHKTPLEQRMEDFGEEMGALGERIGKRVEERHKRHEGWYYNTFGVVGPLISSIFGLVIFALFIWLIWFVNLAADSIFLSSVQSFLSVNIGLFFLIFLFFSYISYFSRLNPKAYAPFSPLAIAVGVAILFWLMGHTMIMVGDFTGVFILYQFGLLLTGNNLFQLFFIVLLIAYLVFFVRVSLGKPMVREERRIVMAKPPRPSRQEPEIRRLYRSGNDKILGGVCGGIGEYLGVDPVIIRLLWVISIFAWGFGILAYIIAWIIIPRNPNHKWKN